MKVTVTDVDALRAVSPIALHAYLSAQGWKKVDVYGEKGDVYAIDSAPEIIAPSSQSFADYERVLIQILTILARVENRDEIAVLRDLSVADVDLIRIRAPKSMDDGSIPINAGVELIQQSRDLLLAAACAESRPQTAYRAGRNRDAMEYLSQVRIGQTERGSFVVALLSPVTPYLANSGQGELCSNFIGEPYARRVTCRLVSALEQTRDAVALANRGEGITVFEERVQYGVSANLCQAAAKLIGNGDGIDVSVSYALTRLAPQRRVRVRFNRPDADVLEEAARVLRDRAERPDEQIDGYVTKLARDPGAKEGQITIKASIDGAMSSIGVYFGPEQYSQIAEAHAQRRTVTLEGDLKREGQRWRLSNPRDLQILDDDEYEEDEEDEEDEGDPLLT